jgi:hypothetical protein
MDEMVGYSWRLYIVFLAEMNALHCHYLAVSDLGRVTHRELDLRRFQHCSSNPSLTTSIGLISRY